MGHKLTLFEIRDINRCEMIPFFVAFFRHLDSDYAVKLAAEKRVRSLTVGFMLSFVNVSDNDDIVRHLQTTSIKFLAAHIADTDIEVFASLRV